MKKITFLLLPLLMMLPFTLFAVSKSEIGIVVMHGKGGNPGQHVEEFASTLAEEGFQVANLEMPWSHKREYDVSINHAMDEITQAFNVMRQKGAQKVFISGLSQGGLFAALYAGHYRVDGVITIAPGGFVNVKSFTKNLSDDIDEAKSLINDGKGDEKNIFHDYEGSRGKNRDRS